MKLPRLPSIFLITLVASIAGYSETLIFHGNGTGPLEGTDKQTVIDSGTYYSISADSTVFPKGDFFFKGEKAGSLEFDVEGKLIKQTMWTSNFNLPKEETVLGYEYKGSLLVRTTNHLNGHLLQDTKLEYDEQGTIVKAVFRNRSLSIGRNGELRTGEEALMICDYRAEEFTRSRTFSFPESPGRLTEKLHYQPSDEVFRKGFSDPATSFDQTYYSNRGLAVVRREYFLGDEDITSDVQTRNLFFVNKGEVPLPSRLE